MIDGGADKGRSADIETARRLRALIVTRAADTHDHTLSDEFVRRLAIRDPIARPTTQHAGRLH